MGGAFSKSAPKKAPPQITDVDRAVLDLKNTRDRLTKYSRQLEDSVKVLVERAKQEKLKGRTQSAIGLLRLKKYKQTQVEQVQEQLFNVHQMVQTIDSQQQNAQLMSSLKAGKDALKKMQQETSVEDVIQLMDEIQDQAEVEQEMAQIFEGAVPTLSIEDESAVEAELAALQKELEGDDAVELPTAPDKPLPAVKDTTDVTTKPTVASQPERVAVPS